MKEGVRSPAHLDGVIPRLHLIWLWVWSECRLDHRLALATDLGHPTMLACRYKLFSALEHLR